MAAYQNVDDICDGMNLDRVQITLVRLLGAGNFGQVSKAIYGASHSEVAVKSLKGKFFGFISVDEFFINVVILFHRSAMSDITRRVHRQCIQ